MKYRKKAVEVSVARAKDVLDLNWEKVPGWLKDLYQLGHVFISSNTVEIRPPGKGLIRCASNDLVVRDGRGEFRAISRDKLDDEYEVIDAPDRPRRG